MWLVAPKYKIAKTKSKASINKELAKKIFKKMAKASNKKKKKSKNTVRITLTYTVEMDADNFFETGCTSVEYEQLETPALREEALLMKMQEFDDSAHGAFWEWGCADRADWELDITEVSHPSDKS